MPLLTTPHPLQLYDGLRNKALSLNWVPTRWRLSSWYLTSGHAKMTTLMDLPVYYASDTRLSCVILETDQGDLVETIGFGEDN